MKKLFINSGEDKYSDELQAAYERAVGDKSMRAGDDFSFDYICKNEIDVVISDGLTPEQYAVLRGVNVATITLGELKKYEAYSDIVIDHRGVDDKRYFTGESSRVRDNYDFPIERITNLITKLEWDSGFFGFNVAFLSCMHLTDNIMHRIEKFIKRENIRLAEYLCNCHNAESVRLAERFGFHFVDVRLTFRCGTDRKDLSRKETPGLNVRLSLPADKPELVKIARNSYVDSRYYFDRNFTQQQCRQFYEDWIVKSMDGKFDDVVLVAALENKVAGFISLKKQFRDTGKIGLVGISPEFQGRGIAKNLIVQAFNWFSAQRVPSVEVITQGRNYAAQRLYQSAGFRTHTVQLWYHKWIY